MCALDGAFFLTEQALIDTTFRSEIKEKLKIVQDKVQSFLQITDAEKIKEMFPILEDEEKVIEEIREIFFKIIKTHHPEKFAARLTESRDYSHSLKV